MKRTKRIMFAALLVLAVFLLAGCSPEMLMDAGERLGNLSSASLGKGGEKYVEAATASVEGFIENYETLIDWEGWTGERVVNPEDGREQITGTLKIKTENREKYSALLWTTVKNLLDAKSSSASDAKLRAALNTSYRDYDGVKKSYSAKAIEWYAYKDMKSVINGVTLGAAISMLIPAGYDLTQVYAYSVPMPVQGLEMNLLIVRASESIMMDIFKSDFFTLFKFIQKIKEDAGGGEESKIKLQDLAYIPERISNYVGDRTDPTVGDKIAVCLLYDIVDTVTKAMVKYVDTHPEETGDDKFDDLDLNWILTNCGEQLDRAMTDIEVISYIYDFNLDVAGLVGKILGD